MICKNLAYWVFTSGEEGVHGLDWGIKHASKSFADRYKLDSRYRSLLKAFRLLPSLERPRKGAGLILLPWQGGGKDQDEETLMGFIFPGSDHKGRPNISTVACVVPADVVRALTPSHVTRVLWSSSDLERIAQKNSVRPDTLYLDEEKASSTTEVPLPLFPSLKWPGKDVGYLMIDGHVRDLKCFYPQLCPPAEGAAKKRKVRMPQLAALLMALALTFGVACCWGSIRDFFYKYLIQPVCSLWSGGDPAPSTDSSEDPETTERRAKRRENLENIIDILAKNKKNKGEKSFAWDDFLAPLKEYAAGAHSILAKCKYHYDGAALTIYAGKKFAKNQIDKALPALAESLQTIGLPDIEITVLATPKPPEDSQTAAIIAMMGGGEEVSL